MDVAALIRSFLLVDLSRLDRRGNLNAELYYDVWGRFWDFASVPRGMHGRLEFCRIEGTVHPNILTVPTEPRQLSDSEDGDSEGGDLEGGDSEGDVVTVKVAVWISYLPSGRMHLE